MSQRESGYQRKPLDQYETPPWVTLALIPHLPEFVGNLGASERQDGRGATVSWFRRGGPLVLQNLVKYEQ